jgi:hypothetical protein
MTNEQTNSPADWYPDHEGAMRWWDGQRWTEHVQPAPRPVYSFGPMTAGQLDVERKVSYVRQQKGHSLTLHLLLGGIVLWIPAIYFTVSPNHYWHV